MPDEQTDIREEEEEENLSVLFREFANLLHLNCYLTQFLMFSKCWPFSYKPYY